MKHPITEADFSEISVGKVELLIDKVIIKSSGGRKWK